MKKFARRGLINRLKRSGVFLCAFVLVFSAVFATIDDEIEQKQREKEALLQIIEEVNAGLSETRQYMQEVNIKISAINAEISKLDGEINELSSQIVETEDDIKAKENELAKLEAELAEKQELLNKRLRVMYKEGSVGYLEVLLGADSLEELLSRADILQTIVAKDQNMILDLDEQKARTDKKKKELAYKRDYLSDLLGQRIDKKAEQKALLDDLYAYSVKLSQDEQAMKEKIAMRQAEQAEIDKIIERLELSKIAYVGGDLIWPVQGSYLITSPFGQRPELAYMAGAFHRGIDIAGNYGTPVLASQSGIVALATTRPSYGNLVILDHGGGVLTAYAHLNEYYVTPGQHVEVGEVIAAVGSTGNSTGPHLHFEVRKNGEFQDPMDYVGKYVR